MNTIQENIELIRKEKGLKQSYIAERLGVGQSAYSNYIQRNSDIKFGLLSHICDIIGCSVVDVITYPEKYVPISEVNKECENCKQKDLIIENLNNYIQILKSSKYEKNSKK